MVSVTWWFMGIAEDMYWVLDSGDSAKCHLSLERQQAPYFALQEGTNPFSMVASL